MSHTFTLRTDYPAPIEMVYASFSDQHYWLARLQDSGASHAHLEQLTIDQDHSVMVATVQTISSTHLPSLVTKIHSGDLVIHRTEKWSPLQNNHSHAQLSATIRDAPAHAQGTGHMYGDAHHTTVDFTISVEVKVPLIGGKIETIIIHHLHDLLTTEQRFTTNWLTHSSDTH